MLKTVTVAQRVEKYGKYGLYDNNGTLHCRPCGKKKEAQGVGQGRGGGVDPVWRPKLQNYSSRSQN